MDHDASLTSHGSSTISQDHEFYAIGGRTYAVLGPLSDGWRPVLAPHGLYGLGTVRRLRGRVELRRQGGRVTSYSGRGLVRAITMLVAQEGQQSR